MNTKKNRLERNVPMDILTYILLILVMLVTVIPVLWGLSTSLKPAAEVEKYPPLLVPSKVDFTNYYNVLFQSNFGIYFKNSIFVTLVCVVVATIVAAHAAYALTRFNIRHGKQIMFGILMTSMIPTVYNTRFLLVLIYTAWRAPMLTWILYGFFQKIPKEIEEAAYVDGCSKTMIFYRIVLPISQGGIISAALLTSVYVWNDFLVQFSFTTQESLRMISVGLYNYITQYGVQWGELMAAVMISIIPIIVLFVCLQRRFVEGMAAGAVKG